MMLKHVLTWQKHKIQIITFLIFSNTLLIVGTTPIHELSHWVMSDIDPYIEPVELHLFDTISDTPNDYVLFSSLGYVIVQEAYPGALKDRPAIWDIVQEIICVSIQILIASFISLKLLLFMLNDKNISKYAIKN